MLKIPVTVQDRDILMDYYAQGDHSPDNVKFPDGSRHSSGLHGTRHAKCYS